MTPSYEWPPNSGSGGGVLSINLDTTAAQTMIVGTAGSDFNIVDAGSGSHVFNLPTASASNRGALSSADWSTFNSKQAALTLGNLTSTGDPNITVTGGTGAVIGAGANIAVVGGSLVESVSSVLTFTGATNAVLGTGVSIQVKLSTTSQSGYLSSTDWNIFNSKGSGTVTAVSIASSNGFAGSSSGGATPAITLSTSITGVLKGDGTALSAATSGTDYSAGTSALATGILKSTTATGALSIAVAGDFPTLNQNTSGTAAGLSATLAVTSGGTGLATLTANNVILGNGASNPTFVAPGTSGNALISNGTTWTSAAQTGAATVATYVDGSSTTLTTGGTFQTIVPTTIIKDTNSGYNGSGVYTIPITGYYCLGGTIQSSTSLVMLAIAYSKNGASAVNMGQARFSVTGANLMASGSALLFLNSGDTIAFQGQASNNSAAISQYDSYIFQVH